MNPILNINPKPPTEVEIITLLFLTVVTIVLLQFTVYTKIKTKYGYRITCRQILRLEMIALKSAIIYTARLTLLFLVIFLPLFGIVLSTDFFVLFSLSSLLLFKVLSLGLFLIDVVIIHYFLGKYGSVYKLPVLFFIRKDIRQFLEKDLDIYYILMIGLIVLIMTVECLLLDLVDTPTVLPKIGVGIIITLLLVYVVRNRKYEKAINLLTSSHHKGQTS